jgi:hypothetical protein
MDHDEAQGQGLASEKEQSWDLRYRFHMKALSVSLLA